MSKTKTGRRVDAEKRQETFLGRTIGQQLQMLEEREGASQREAVRLRALVEHKGVTERTTIDDAQIIAGKRTVKP
jgi:hypothetical protein